MTTATRGPTPSLVEDTTLRAWWVAGRWDCLVPVLDQVARRATRTVLGGDPDAMDDVVQQTLCNCWRHPECPDRVASFVFRAARNNALDVMKAGYVKRRVRRYTPASTAEDRSGEADPYDEATGTEPDALDVIVTAETHQRLRLALRRLPDHLRRPLILHTFHRRTAADLAGQWQIKEGAMKMRLTRARLLLASIFDATLPRLPHE
jgi:RNA polymerase sigma factor (sigma-70 family)